MFSAYFYTNNVLNMFTCQETQREVIKRSRIARIMSHMVMRGKPTKAQIYLDTVLDALVEETGRQEDRYSLPKMFFKIMRDNPDDVRQIEGSSGIVETNKVVLERSVRTSLALQQAGLKPGDIVIVISKNVIEMSAVYFGSMFAGVAPFPLHVGVTVYELKRFIELSEPRVIFTEKDYVKTAEQAMEETGSQAKIVVLGEDSVKDHQTFSEFTTGYEQKVQAFRPVDNDRNSPVLILATSGSTGLPKAAVLTSQGLLAQVTTFWIYSDVFPTPTRLMLVLSTAHWVSYTMNVTTAVAYRCPVLITSQPVTIDHVRNLLRKYKPTLIMTTTPLAQGLLGLPGGHPDDLKCLEILVLAGSAVPEKVFDNLKKSMMPDAHLKNGYGLTEMQGACIISRPGLPAICLGQVINVTLFKIIDNDGNTLGPNQPGQLCFKSDTCLIRGYLKNEEAYKEAFTDDGWFRTGDQVYMNQDEEVYFVERLKFLIKYQNHQVSPSELEDVIAKVDGVAATAVCAAEEGPAALVVPRPGHKLIPQDIHNAVKSTLSDEKRLRGGVVFVSSIPVSINGKIDRSQVKDKFEGISKNEISYDQ